MEKICTREGCGRLATHGIKIKLWAKGRSKCSHTPIEGFFDLGLCLPHAIEDAADGARLMSVPKAQQRIAAALRGLGRAEPDFETCEAEAAPRKQIEEGFGAMRSNPNTIVG